MGCAVSKQRNHRVDYLQVRGIGEVAGGGGSSLEGTVLRGHVGGSLQRPELAPFCCPAHFFPAVMLFLEAFPELQRSTFCSRQQDVCLLFALFTKRNFSLMSAFNLYFLHAAFVGCFGQEQSSGAAHVLFYHRAIKYLAFQRKNPVVAA